MTSKVNHAGQSFGKGTIAVAHAFRSISGGNSDGGNKAFGSIADYRGFIQGIGDMGGLAGAVLIVILIAGSSPDTGSDFLPLLGQKPIYIIAGGVRPFLFIGSATQGWGRSNHAGNMTYAVIAEGGFFIIGVFDTIAPALDRKSVV